MPSRHAAGPEFAATGDVAAVPASPEPVALAAAAS
jgi:hypothetical protein